MTACAAVEAFAPRPAYGPPEREGRSQERTLLALALANIPALRPADRMAAYAAARDCRDLSAMGLAEIREVTGRGLPRAEWDSSRAVADAERCLGYCARRGIGLLGLEDPGYPPLLREIHEPPFLLFHRGPLPDPERPSVAVVGTRRPGMEAFAGTRLLSRSLAEKGLPVVSGLALGIDRAAHEGALSAGGYTLAVLGSGIDSVYPSSHVPLASRILCSGGCILSEYPPGWQPLKYRFPERNRIISGLCRAVVVAQAPERSGALITAEFALDQGRDLFVMRCGTEGEEGAGARKLAEEGARLVSGADDIVSEWGA